MSEKPKVIKSWVCSMVCSLVNSAFGRLRQEEPEFGTSLGYLARPYQERKEEWKRVTRAGEEGLISWADIDPLSHRCRL